MDRILHLQDYFWVCVRNLVTNTPISFIKSFLEGTIKIVLIEIAYIFYPTLLKPTIQKNLLDRIYIRFSFT